MVKARVNAGGRAKTRAGDKLGARAGAWAVARARMRINIWEEGLEVILALWDLFMGQTQPSLVGAT